VLHSFTPKVGDVVALPAGLVHAIGSGLVVAEIQQNSDLTLRIYDYKRLGLDGKPRKLHVKEALEAIRFGDPGHEFDGNMRADTVEPLSKETKSGVTEELVLRGIYFDLLRYTVKAGAELRLPPLRSAPRCLMTIAGNGKLNARAVKAGETMLACAAADALTYHAGSESILLVSIPKRAAC
jgi:mannose-6-phosphate isomerase class I